MRYRATHLTLAVMAIALTACSGSNDSSIASRLARAASRSIVDAVSDVDYRSDSDETAATSTEPLTLASSRPDSILGPTPSSAEAIGSYHIDAMSEAQRGPATLEADAAASGMTGHLVTATVLSNFARKCETEKTDLSLANEKGIDSNVDATRCPLTKETPGRSTQS